jgi:hypothetical protein
METAGFSKIYQTMWYHISDCNLLKKRFVTRCHWVYTVKCSLLEVLVHETGRDKMGICLEASQKALLQMQTMSDIK